MNHQVRGFPAILDWSWTLPPIWVQQRNCCHLPIFLASANDPISSTWSLAHIPTTRTFILKTNSRRSCFYIYIYVCIYQYHYIYPCIIIQYLSTSSSIYNPFTVLEIAEKSTPFFFQKRGAGACSVQAAPGMVDYSQSCFNIRICVQISISLSLYIIYIQEMCVYIYIYSRDVCAYIYICIHIYVYIYIYIYVVSQYVDYGLYPHMHPHHNIWSICKLLKGQSTS